MADQYSLESALPLAEAISWLLRAGVLTVTTRWSVCWFTDFVAEARMLLCSITLHRKENISVIEASPLQLSRR